MSVERSNHQENEPNSIRVGIVGKGQIGTMLEEVFNGLPHTSVTVAGRNEIRGMLLTNPQVIILATPNPVTEVTEEINRYAQKNTIVLLPQNGVGVVEDAEQSIRNPHIKTVRASIFTPVHTNETGVSYNKHKLRIALARTNTSFPEDIKTVRDMFTKAGFKTHTCEDYVSMEWTKMLINCIGSTSTITGLTPYETFNDPQLFAIELKGLKDRIDILKGIGIPLASIPWAKTKTLMFAASYISESMHPSVLAFLRPNIASFIAKSRDNQPSAASRKVLERKPIYEAMLYHTPFYKAALEYKLPLPVVDECMISIIAEHNNGSIRLDNFDPEQRKRLLLQQYQYVSQRT